MDDKEKQTPETETAENESAVETTAGEEPEAGEHDAPESEDTPADDAEAVSEEEDEGPPLHTPGMDWFVLRVQSGREDTVRRGLEKRIKDMDLEDLIARVLVPKESVSEIKGKRKRVLEKKLYPGYIFVEMKVTDETFHFIKETPGIGDFVGTPRKPVPMPDHEIEKLLGDQRKAKDKSPTVKINFEIGDAVKINSGPFENFDGLVEEVNPGKGIVIVMVTIFGRATPVELEYWQVERI